MKNILYIPWFQESNNDSSPWKIIASQVSGSFQRLILPWDISSPINEKFSLSDLEDKIMQTLSNTKEAIHVIAYSLSALPTLRGIISNSDEGISPVLSCSLLHPAKNPLEAVQIMDWTRRRWRWDILSLEHYTEWDTSEIYDKLIWKWNGNPEQFQRDLSFDFSDIYWNELMEYFRIQLWFTPKIYSSSQDIIIWEKDIKGKKVWETLRSHFPSEELITELVNNL